MIELINIHILGTMGYEPEPAKPELKMGSLYSLDSAHIVKNHRDKVDLSNGLTWTLDNRTMFFIDSVPRKVYAFDFDLSTGSICMLFLLWFITYVI